MTSLLLPLLLSQWLSQGMRVNDERVTMTALMIDQIADLRQKVAEHCK